MLSAGWIDTPADAVERVYRSASERGTFMHLPSDVGGGWLPRGCVIAGCGTFYGLGDKGGTWPCH